jgi:osmotically inducible protein OsmC
MPVRKAEATWNGSLREGSGSMKGSSGAFQTTFSAGTRFEETPGTNPEELIGAAHAGCFSMAFSGDLGRAGFTPEYVRTTANVHIDRLDTGWTITKIELNMEAKVPGIDNAKFQEIAAGTKTGCPVSRALAAIPEIALKATLVK